jgi:DNA repair ATPase RecN
MISLFDVLLRFDIVCLDFIRRKNGEALTKLIQLQSQAKLWATETRITAQTEIQILLSKVITCIEQADLKVSEHAVEIKTLLQEKQQMQEQMCCINGLQEKYRSKIVELNVEVGSANEQIQNLSSDMKVIYNINSEIQCKQ